MITELTLSTVGLIMGGIGFIGGWIACAFTFRHYVMKQGK